MSKRPPKPGQNPFPLRPGARPTVPLPPSAMGSAMGSATGQARPTVGLPFSAYGQPVRTRRPTAEELLGGVKAAAERFERRDYAGAAAILKQVLNFDPGQPDALHLLGLIAFDTGKPEDAEELILLALRSGKPHANILVNLGNARAALGKTDEALASYARALDMTPGFRLALLHRSRVYEALQRTEDALADLREMMRLDPRDALPYVQAIRVLMQRGGFREGLDLCEEARSRLERTPAALLVLKAELHERLTEMEPALACIEEAMALDPKLVSARRMRSRILRRNASGDMALLATLRTELEAAARDALPVDEMRALHAELAQICDRLGDTDAAFHHFVQQNEAAAKEAAAQRCDKNVYLAQVEHLIDTLTPAHVATWRELPPPAAEPGHRAAPVFLVGFPRSGTTLLDQILDAHPDVQVLEELPLIIPVRDAVDAVKGGYPAALAEIGEAERARLREVYWAALETEKADFRGKVVINKLPLNLIHAALIQRVFPEAKFILALRHPADSVLSCFMQDFQLNSSMANFLTIEDSARLYDRVMTLWQTCAELLPLNVVEVRYENLIRDLRGEVTPVLDFLGLPWHEAQADPAAHALARGTIRTPSYAQVIQPLYTSAADRWRRYEKHLAPALPLLEKHIRKFGYGL